MGSDHRPRQPAPSRAAPSFHDHGEFGAWPFIALAHALNVIRPWPSAGRRPRTRSFNSATASASISSRFARGPPVAVVTCQKLSKLSKLRWTVIARVSISSSPASVHKPCSARAQRPAGVRGQRGVDHRVANAAESVAVGIGHLHEHRIGYALNRRLNRVIAQPQFVQDVREVTCGSLGNFARDSASVTSVPSARDGNRLFGGATPCSTHSNSATSNARMNAP